MRRLAALLAVLGACGGSAARPAAPEPAAASREPTTPVSPPTTADRLAAGVAWSTLKSLAGTYRASRDNGAAIDVELRLVSRGSAVLELFRTPGGETVTMMHPDGDRLLLTHYCAQGNQARLALVASTPSRLAFRFLDATNRGADGSVLVELVLARTVAGFDRTEVYEAPDGARETTVMHFARR